MIKTQSSLHLLCIHFDKLRKFCNEDQWERTQVPMIEKYQSALIIVTEIMILPEHTIISCLLPKLTASKLFAYKKISRAYHMMYQKVMCYNFGNELAII